MSHANVYRFFRNKADLADAVASLWLEKSVAAGNSVVARGGSASSRLTALAIELYRVKKRELLRTKRVHQLLLQAERTGTDGYEDHRRNAFSDIERWTPAANIGIVSKGTEL